jgi:hypothetical protein
MVKVSVIPQHYTILGQVFTDDCTTICLPFWGVSRDLKAGRVIMGTGQIYYFG